MHKSPVLTRAEKCAEDSGRYSITRNDRITKISRTHLAFFIPPVLVIRTPSFSQYRPQRYSRFGRQNPLLLRCNCNRACSAVTRRVASPERFPSISRRRCKQRFRSRFEDLAVSKIHHEQPIIILARKISENETGRSEHRAIDSARDLFANAGIFASQF